MRRSSLNWQTWLQNGDQYMKAATPRGTISRLGAVVRYNLLSMSLEGYAMAILDYYGKLPANHTFTDLMEAISDVFPVAENLRLRILKYETIQSICTLEEYRRSTPTEEELCDFREAVYEFGAIAHGVCRLPAIGTSAAGSPPGQIECD